MDTAVTSKPTKERYPNRFKPGNSGKPVGAKARYTRVIKEALLIAAEEHGKNGNGKDKLIGFMRKVIEEDLKTFCMMMARAMTLQVETREMETKGDSVYKSMEEVKREFASRGLDFEVVFRLAQNEVSEMDGTDGFDE